MSVKAACDDLISIIRWIDERSKTPNIPGDARSQIAAACFDIVLEHQAAIALLIGNELYGSAHAMLRVVAEAFFRGIWISRCAADADVTRFQKDKFDKPVSNMVQEIESALNNSTDALSHMVKSNWGMLCSFTHTGYLQVTRRYSGAILKPSYSDKEIVQTLNFAGAIGLLAAAELAHLSQNTQLVDAIEERADAYASQNHGHELG